jgi:CheY-like chemotaxis protein
MEETRVKPLHVFIVDDDWNVAESPALLAETRDCEVELAFSRKEAIQKFSGRDFDIAFMDEILPGMDGDIEKAL